MKINFLGHLNFSKREPLAQFSQKNIKQFFFFQTSLDRKFSNFSYISFFCVNFENLTDEFNVPYILNMHIKFSLNRMLFIIRSINLFFIHNFISQKLEILTFV